MRDHLPPSVRVAVLAILTLGLFIGSSFSFPSTGAPIFPSVSPAVSSLLNEWLRPEAARADVPNVSTDKADYAPGEIVTITGTGFGPYDEVTLQVTDIGPRPTLEADASGYGTWTVTANENGEFTTTWLVGIESGDRLLLLTAIGKSGASAQTTFTDANPSADLDQCANDPAPSPNTDGCSSAASDWVNGNLGASKSVYQEGDSIPYRLRFDNLSLSTHTVAIEWDTTKGGTHAIDYITTFNRSVLDADPCLGVSSCGSATTFPIPKDPQVDNGSGSPIVQAPGNFTMFGGTITSVSAYTYPDGAGFAGDKSARITITFTASQANPVLAWGGHIAQRRAGGGSGGWGDLLSAINIPGSPYHTRLIALDGSGGNQDRSLSADAVIFPGSITIIKDANPNGPTDFAFSGSPSPLGGFSLDDDSDNTLSNTKVFSNITTFQTYTVAETVVSPWVLDDIVCSVESANGGSVTPNDPNSPSVTINLKEGEIVTCTFKNSNAEELNGRIIVDKVTVPSTDTTNFSFVTNYGPGGFSLNDAAAPNNSGLLSPVGTYSVTETANSNYVSSVNCVSDVDGRIVSDNTSISLIGGEIVTCTFTNIRKPKLTLVKQVSGGTATASQWNLSATGTSGSFSGAGPTVGPNFVSVGVAYALTESSGPSGYTASDYSCVTTPFGGVAGSPVSGNSITLVAGDSAVCTITNTRDLGSLKINKVFDPLTSGYAGTFAINYDCDDGTTHDGTLNLLAGGTQTINGIPTGTTCVVSEPATPTNPTGWTFGAPVLSDSQAPTGDGTVVITTKATTYEVTVTNTISRDVGKFKISKTTSNPDGATLPTNFTGTYDCGTGYTGTWSIASPSGSQTVNDIPTGNTCSVTEDALTPITGYTWGTPSFTPTTIQISTKGGTFEIVVANSITRDLGNFKITKNTSNPDGATLPASFTGTYNCGTGFTGTWSVANGGSQTVTSIPTGNTCSVTEDALSSITGYTWGTPSFTPTSIVISTKGGTFEIVVGNSITRDKGSLVLAKSLTGGPAGYTGPFTIHWDCGTFGSGDKSVSAGSSETISNIPTGTSCTVSEPNLPTPPTGYSFGTPSFSPSATVTIPAGNGSSVTVTTNNSLTRDTGSFKITKTVSNPDGATLPSAFTGTYDCGTGYTGTWSVAAGGSQTVSNIPTGNSCSVTEDALSSISGYTWGTPSFTPASIVVSTKGGTFEIVVGNSITRDRGTFTIEKTLSNPDNASVPSTFSVAYNCGLDTDGSALTGNRSIAPGSPATVTGIPTGNTCSVTETAPDAILGYTWGTITYTPASIKINDTTSTFKITVGNSITRDRGSLQIKKTLSNPDSASVPSSFTVNYDCGTGYTGSKSIAPGSPATVSGIPTGNTCTVTEVAPAAIPNFTWGTITYTPASITIDTKGGTFCITVGNSITRDRGSLTLVKKVVNDNGGSATVSAFGLNTSAGGLTFDSGTANGSTTTYTSQKMTVVTNTYTLKESDVYGYTEGTWSCTGAAGTVVSTFNNGSVPVAKGEDVVCTITNDDQPGTIVIIKNAKPANGSFAFTTTGTGYNGFTLTGSTASNGNKNSQSLNAGTYTVKESTQLGWLLTGIGGSTDPNTPYACTVNTGGTSDGAGDLSTQTATIHLKIGDTVTCVFENTGNGATRTQGFWATHTPLANIAWFGGSAFNHTFPGVANTTGIGDTTICGRSIDTLGKLMGGFWSDISKDSKGKKRSALDQARMQLLQQLLAAELNASAFGSVPAAGTGAFATWESAYCGTNQTNIQNAMQGAASFNNSGDSTTFTPGTSADSKNARAIATYTWWDSLP
jgi:hypothetical protein